MAKKNDVSFPPREPFVRIIEFSAQRTVPADSLIPLFSVTSLEVTVKNEVVYVLNVKSRDINKNPYLFTRVALAPTSIELAYSITPEVSEQKRDVEAIIELLQILTIVESGYRIKEQEFFSYLSSLFERIISVIDVSFEELSSKYETLLSEYSRLQKRIADLNAEIDTISKTNMVLKEKNDELMLRVKELEKMSDETLMLKIQEWLREHHNEINVGQFAKIYNVSERRVEEVLDKMVKAGYLA